MALVLVGTTALFATTAPLWSVLTSVVGSGYEPPETDHGSEGVQVRP